MNNLRQQAAMVAQQAATATATATTTGSVARHFDISNG